MPSCPKCGLPSVGKSRYCYTHRAESRTNFKLMCSAQSEERASRYARFEEIYREAKENGIAAGNTAKPTPMTVVGHLYQLDDNSPVTQSWYVPEGACGFAWVTIYPGTKSFSKWLVKQGYAHSAYGGGVEIWISEHNQSIERKEKHADAMRDVFRKYQDELMVKVYSGSRMD